MSLQKLNNDQLFIADEKREAIDFVRTVVCEGFPALVVREMREKFAMSEDEIATVDFTSCENSHAMKLFIYNRNAKTYTRSYELSVISSSESGKLLVTYGYFDYVDNTKDEFCAYRVEFWDEDENAFYSDYNYYRGFIELCKECRNEKHLIIGCFTQLVKDEDRLNFCLSRGLI